MSTGSPWAQGVLWAGTSDETSRRARWATPRAVVDQLQALYGSFVLDAAAEEATKATPHYLGLDGGEGCMGDARYVAWGDAAREAASGDASSGRHLLWLNPPYSRAVGKWILRAEEQAIAGNVDVLCLVFARTDTAWWHDVAMYHEVLLYRGRLKFVDPVTLEEAAAAPAPSVVIRVTPHRLTWPSVSTLERPKGEA